MLTGETRRVRARIEKLGEVGELLADYVAESERRGEPAALPALGFELAALPRATAS